ncbi:MAG: ABC transporter substrate-binding protein [Candidatus Nanoarchaeia archaeon]
MRVISLNPTITEILFALDAAHLIVGVSKFCDYPSEVKDKPIVGKPDEPDLDLVEELQPDLIFTMNEATKKKILQLGIQVCFVQPKTLAEVFDSFITIGEAVHAADKARTLVNKKKAKLASIEMRTKNLTRKRIMIDAHVPPWLVECGVLAAADIFPGRFNEDDLTNFDPELILTDNPEKYSRSTHKLEPFILKPGPRIPEVVEWLGSHTHPAQFSTFGSMRANIDSYYKDIELPNPKAQYEM